MKAAFRRCGSVWWNLQRKRGMALQAVLEPQEVCLPVPWGHVSGKAWGNPANKPVLAIHGWLDNAGSFDRLAPLLASDLYIVAVDLPGHGRSSHRPPGTHYSPHLYVADIKFIVDALKWERFGLLGHSMGGGAASWFSGALPGQVDRLVLLEGLGFWPVKQDDIPDLMGQALTQFSKLSSVSNKTYPSYEAAVDRLLEGHVKRDKLFDRESSHILCIRGTQQLEDGTYQFTRDLRLNFLSLMKMSYQLNSTFLNAIKCPVLLIWGDSQESMVFIKELSVVVARLKSETSMQLQVATVTGGHHMHLYAPGRVQAIIGSFLNGKEANKL